MKEEREHKSAAGAGGATKDTTADERHAQATSSETLSDLEESQSANRTKAGASGSQKDAPAPDGAASVGERGGRADGSDSGGPM